VRTAAAFLPLLLAGSLIASAQTPDAPQCRLTRLPLCVRQVAQDEIGIVASPLHTAKSDLLWILPFGAATGLAVHYDSQAIQDLGVHPDRENNFENLSTWGGLYLPFGASAAAYFAGTSRHNSYLTETAVLSAEAMADAGILNEGLKYALDREGPRLDNARGGLWPDGPKGWPNSPSMPSEHAMNIWAFAHVVTGQYNGIATKTILYSLAGAVSVSRVVARQHFPSDVVVGSTLGWLVGGYVLRHRSLEHGSLVDLSQVRTPLGQGLELRLNLSRLR
jgi:membrane-associated phospholipid phosphatase